MEKWEGWAAEQLAGLGLADWEVVGTYLRAILDDDTPPLERKQAALAFLVDSLPDRVRSPPLPLPPLPSLPSAFLLHRSYCCPAGRRTWDYHFLLLPFASFRCD